MRALNEKFEIESNSTFRKEKKFSRRSSSKSINSKGNRESSSSISKFWVKEMKPNFSSGQIETALCKTMSSESCIPIPVYEVSPRKSNNRGKSRETSKYKKQIESMKKEIHHYELYTEKQSQTIKELRNVNEELKNQIRELKQSMKSESKLYSKEAKNSEKPNDYESMNEGKYEKSQKEQKSISKIKLEILQSRISEYEKEKVINLAKIEDLEFNLQKCQTKINELESEKNNTHTSNPITDSGIYLRSESIERESILKELHESRNEVQKLQIASICMQKKFFSEMQTLKQKKEGEYDHLKKKYEKFLNKYRLSMKNNTIENTCKEKEKAVHEFLERSSFFILSEDEDISFEK